MWAKHVLVLASLLLVSLEGNAGLNDWATSISSCVEDEVECDEGLSLLQTNASSFKAIRARQAASDGRHATKEMKELTEQERQHAEKDQQVVSAVANAVEALAQVGYSSRARWLRDLALIQGLRDMAMQREHERSGDFDTHAKRQAMALAMKALDAVVAVRQIGGAEGERLLDSARARDGLVDTIIADARHREREASPEASSSSSSREALSLAATSSRMTSDVAPPPKWLLLASRIANQNATKVLPSHTPAGYRVPNCTVVDDPRFQKLSSAVEGTPCMFQADVRDEGYHCIPDPELGTLGWCYTKLDKSEFGRCAESCPLWGTASSLLKKLGDLDSLVVELSQAIDAEEGKP